MPMSMRLSVSSRRYWRQGELHHIYEPHEFLAEGFSRRHETLKTIAVYSDIAKDIVSSKLKKGEITGCGKAVPTLTLNDIEAAPTVVGQMGSEPLVQAMIEHPDFDILIAGRAYDPVPYIAFCAFQAIRRTSTSQDFNSLKPTVLGGFTHMGKIMECGGICAAPKSRGAMATVYACGTFDVTPLDPGARCTPLSVAAHTLYEKTRPDILHGPGGYLDLTHSKYVPLEDGISVRVRGSIFIFSTAVGANYTVKLEGAKLAGYRTILLGSFIDPILMGQMDKFLNNGKAYISKQFPASAGKWKLDWHLTGLEQRPPKKVFIVAEALADTQEFADSIAATFRVYCAHGPYEGQKATSGNFAMGIGGRMQYPAGACAEFCIYHLMELDPGSEGGKEVTTDDSIDDVHRQATLPLFGWKYLALNIDAHTHHARCNERPGSPLEPMREEHNVALIKKEMAVLPSTLGDIAKVVRSKNAGPYELTFDVIFDDPAIYHIVKSSGLLNEERVAKLFDRSVDEIIWCGFFDPALGFKVTLPRKRNGIFSISGGFMEDDVHGSQQYMPLMDMPLDDSLVATLAES